jgi:hypothetical protein
VDDFSEVALAADDTVLVPVDIDGRTVYLTARQKGGSGEEREIADRRPRLESVLSGAASFAKQVVDTFQDTGASKVSVEFGCEFALESGTFVAVIGKASTKSTLTIGLEWAKPGE